VHLRELNLAQWRQKIGYVSQDTFVFNDTIRNNITFGGPVATAALDLAVKMAQLYEFIQTLPQGYDTVVGDRGIRLSGGQCQRLAIARAIYRQPDVFVFDEATSALDNLTERVVYNAINELHRDAIVIVIAHRLSTVKHADQIIVLDAGRVVDVGIHENLMIRQGLYAHLYHEMDRRETQGSPEVVASTA